MAQEIALSKEELAELNDYAQQGYKILSINEEELKENPEEILPILEKFISTKRENSVTEDEATELAFSLGSLLAKLIQSKTGWEWCIVTQDNGFESYGLVRPDRSFVFYTIKYIYDLLLDHSNDINNHLLFNMIVSNSLGQGKKNEYMSLG